MTFQQLVLFVPVAFVVGASPGANNLLAFASAARAGWRRAAQAVAGRIAAWGILVVLVALGLDRVLAGSALAFGVLKWAGVAYLAFLAVRFWRAETRDEPAPPASGDLMRREFFTLMGNPKAYLLLTAFLPQFVMASAPALPQLLALGGVYLAVEAVAAMAWVVAGALVGRHALTPMRRRLVNRTSAGAMGVAAFVLARSQRAG